MADARRSQAETAGRRAERLAAWWLRLKGWRILAMRVRTPFGEVDLVARRGRMVAFVEVKHRATVQDLDFAIDHHRLRRVAAAAEALTPRFVRAQDDARIDLVLLAPRRLPRHLTHVWQGD
jgi:putative endonuclease